MKHKIFWTFHVALVAMTLLLAHSMARAQTVYVDSNTDVATAQFVAWSWKLRSGMNVTYGGTTSSACIDNAIVIRKAYAGEWPYSPPIPAATGVCGTGGYRVYYPSTINLQVMNHEGGHALNTYNLFTDITFCSPHTCDSGALMNSAPVVWAVTQADITRATPRWPVTGTPDLCYAELQPDFDLYIPEISGYRVMLNYTGIIDGHHTWVAANTQAVGTSQGCTVSTLVGGNAVLTDVKGYPNLHYSATLEPYSGGWRAISVTPL